MKPAILYDADCPACKVYTKGFVKLGLLASEDRLSNHTCQDQRIIERLDPERMRHEIPLVDLEGPEVRYGVDAVLTLIGIRFPRLANVIRRTFLYNWAKGLYAFISYNRRIIIPAKPERWQLLDFAPRFHAGYRIGLIMLLVSCTGLMYWLAGTSISLISLLCFGTVLLSGAIGVYQVSTTDRIQSWLDYLGHVSITVFFGTVLYLTGVFLGWSFLTLLASALMIWQLIIRLQVLLLPVWLIIPFTLWLLTSY